MTKMFDNRGLGAISAMFLILVILVSGAVVKFYVVDPIWGGDDLPSIGGSVVIQRVSVYTLSDGQICAADESGVQYNGTDFSTVVYVAWGLLSPGRTWQETVTVLGNYTITSQIIVPSFTLLDLSGARLRAANNLNVHPIYASNAVYVDIVGGYVDGNSAGQGASAATDAIYYYGCNYSNVKGLTLLDGGHSNGTVDIHEGEGIKFNYCFKCEVDSCQVFCSATTYDAIKFLNCRSCTSENNYVNSSSTASGCIQVGYGDLNVVHGCYLTTSNEGIKCHFAANTTIGSNVIFADYGIDLIDNSSDTFITGNRVYHVVRGIQSRNASGLATVWYTNNTVVEGNWFSAIYRAGYTPSTLFLVNAHNFHFKGNVVKGNPAAGEYFLNIMYSGYAGSVDRLFVQGNDIVDITVLKADTGSTNFYWCEGNVVNWVPCELAGNATISSGTSVVVTPGVPVGVPIYNVDVIAANSGMGAYSVSAKTATTFTITVSNTGTWYFYYEVKCQP